MPSKALLPLLGLVVAGSLFTRSAHADQCAWIEQDAAQRVASELPIGSEVVSYCALCGDEQPGAPEQVASMQLRPTEVPALQEVFINDQPVDLAYTYVSRGDGADRSFVNLAHLVGCPSHGSPHALGMAAPPVIAAAPVVAAPPVITAPTRAETCTPATAPSSTNPIQVRIAPLALTTYLLALSSGLFGAVFVFFIATVRRRRESDRLGLLSSARGPCEK